jgi:hypothetical protein
MARSSREARAAAGQPVRLEVLDSVEGLVRARCPALPGLRYLPELERLWAPPVDPDRFVYQGVLAVVLAKLDGRLAGWGELLTARPARGEATTARAFCRISRLDVAPAYRRRSYVDPESGLPLSELLLKALLEAAPFGAEITAEVTPDAENLFERAGFRLRGYGRWTFTH